MHSLNGKTFLKRKSSEGSARNRMICLKDFPFSCESARSKIIPLLCIVNLFIQQKMWMTHLELIIALYYECSVKKSFL